jgi:biotin carboxyl carrier protein
MIAVPGGGNEAAADHRTAAGAESDPRAVRAAVAPTSRLEGDPSISLAPPPSPAPGLPAGTEEASAHVLVDGVATDARLVRFGESRARLEQEMDAAGDRTDVLFGPVRRDRSRGIDVREVVVGGWRVEIEVEPERRALLRERARRGAAAASLRGPVEVRAIIPGRIVAVSVVGGDAIDAGQPILVVEAMKMQNELRAPREGLVERIAVAVGDTIQVGDLLVVIH